MEQLQPRDRFGHPSGDETLRRMIMVAGAVLAAVVLAAAAVYAAAFPMLAPIMQ